jgi:hypothetical protein
VLYRLRWGGAGDLLPFSSLLPGAGKSAEDRRQEAAAFLYAFLLPRCV